MATKLEEGGGVRHYKTIFFLSRLPFLHKDEQGKQKKLYSQDVFNIWHKDEINQGRDDTNMSVESCQFEFPRKDIHY